MSSGLMSRLQRYIILSLLCIDFKAGCVVLWYAGSHKDEYHWIVKMQLFCPLVLGSVF